MKRIALAVVVLTVLIVSCSKSAMPVCGSPSFSDEFTGTTLGLGWTWVDPLLDCSYSLAVNPGYLRISVPGDNHDIYPYSNLNAPRVMQAVDNDFVIETKILLNPQYNSQHAGILIWKDPDNYMRFIMGISGLGHIIIVTTKNSSSYVESPWVSYNETTVYLKLERNADMFTASYSNNGVDWTLLGNISFQIVDPIYIGLCVIDQWQDNPIYADFDYFRVTEAYMPSSNPVGGTSIAIGSRHSSSWIVATIMLLSAAIASRLCLRRRKHT